MRMLNNTEKKAKISHKKLVKPLHIPSYGKTVNVLLDLGRCYGLTSGYNSLSIKNIQEYVNLAKINTVIMSENAKEVYSTDICKLKQIADITSETSDSIRFGELCKLYDEISRDNRSNPAEQSRFMASITSKLTDKSSESLEKRVDD